MKKTIRICVIIAFLLGSPRLLMAQTEWPREIPLKSGGVVIIYQPQPETFEGNKLTGRAAVSVKKTAKEDPIFGAVWWDAMLFTNTDSRMADLDSLDITNMKFPGVENQTDLDQLKKIIEDSIENAHIEISIDRLVTSIKQERQATKDNFKNDPPTIIYRNKPTTLIVLDGEPKIKKDKDLDADRVMNTPFLIFKEGSQWNLYAGGIWYKSASVKEGWSPNKALSTKLKSIDDQVKKQEKEGNNGQPLTTKPEVTDILISTSPAELLQTKGEAEYKSIQGTQLLYVSNTTNEIFKEISSQKTFVLLAGRWYTAAAIDGPWEYVASDKLPDDFAKIPEGSEKDAVLASVAGTDAAEEAKMDAQIPQTAKVDRKTATVKVEYDGSPKFKNIEGTSLQLAENSNVTVMKDADGKYFALDNGVWFTSGSANGPWSVANERPKDVEKIPASSEAYNTKYVYVYESTPEYVYMGYTPGYMGSYIWGPTVVYGTGFYYNPWFGAMYYPRPVTWGFGFGYNPWMGWSMNFGFGFGFMNIGFGIGFGGGYYGGGCFGPGMYRPPYRPGWGGGYYGGHNNINIGNNVNINGNHINNIYNNHKGVSTKDIKRNPNSKVGNNMGSRPGGNRPSTRPSTQPNNVFAGKDGNVFQRDNKGNFNQRDNGARDWKPANQDRSRDMNRDGRMRDRGAARSNNFNGYNRSRPAGGGMRGGGGGGGMRGGGGRRR